MLDFLGNILSAIEAFPTLIVDGVDTVINGLFLAMALFVRLLFGLLPTMPNVPNIGGGQWLGWLNWFYPVGTVLTALAGLITMYLIYMGIRYALNVIKAL